MEIGELLTALDGNLISIEDFANHFSGNLNTRAILRYFGIAIENKNSDWIEYLVIAADKDGLNRAYSKVFCELLSEDWHYKHEDIVMCLEDIKDPETVGCIYKTSLRYVDYDDAKALQRKCIWALNAIGTAEAIEKIKLLAQSENSIVKEFALFLPGSITYTATQFPSARLAAAALLPG